MRSDLVSRIRLFDDLIIFPFKASADNSLQSGAEAEKPAKRVEKYFS